MIALPFDTPTANVLRFLLLEYVILKLLIYTVEASAAFSAARRASRGQKLHFREGWPSFFLVPYRIHERTALRAAVPWLLALLLNAFVLSIEFSFGTMSFSPTAVSSAQEIAADVLGPSTPPDGVAPIRWIDRAQKLHEKCVDRRGFLVFAADGFVRDERLANQPNSIMAGDTICGSDSRVQGDLNRILFNISHSGLEDTKEPFKYTWANLTVKTITTSRFGFPGGDLDLDVAGTLDLSLAGFNQRDYFYTVSGSCTGYVSQEDSSGTTTTLFDPQVYCYLTDEGNNRFIFPGILTQSSEIKVLARAVSGQKLQLRDASSCFRAEMLDYLEEGKHKDGEHLAAIKTLAVAFTSRGGTESTVPLILSSITRTFCIASLFGATSFKETTILLTEGSPTERAAVSTWGFALLCVMLGLLVVLALVLFLFNRSEVRWNIPVRFNALTQMAVEETCCKTGEPVPKGTLVCGLHYREDTLHYGPIDSAQEAERVQENQDP